MSKPTVAIGCDHAGFSHKEHIKKFLDDEGYEVKDYGTYSAEPADYPDFAHPVATAVEEKEYDYGVLICGSGQGVAMAANKHQEIRAALCWNNEIATLSRTHNDANIICLPAHFANLDLCEVMVTTFLTTAFEGGRHARRVGKIACGV